MTANAFSDDIRQTKEAGMDAHLSKPIETEILHETLNRLMKVETIHTRQKILVVDDVEINRVAVRVSLEDKYEMLEACNGQEAMEMIQK